VSLLLWFFNHIIIDMVKLVSVFVVSKLSIYILYTWVIWCYWHYTCGGCGWVKKVEIRVAHQALFFLKLLLFIYYMYALYLRFCLRNMVLPCYWNKMWGNLRVGVGPVMPFCSSFLLRSIMYNLQLPVPLKFPPNFAFSNDSNNSRLHLYTAKFVKNCHLSATTAL